MNRFIEIKDFIKEIDNKFWKHITTEGVIKDIINYRDIDKDARLISIAKKINKGVYRPSPGKIIGFPKNKGIIRPVMHLNIDDKIVYYYCVKKMQDELVQKIKEIPHMYGGFRITEKVIINEEDIENLAYDPDYEGFNKIGYRKEWSDYQNLAKALSDKNYSYYMHLDIAHFYDAIPLKRLELHVRKTYTDKNICDLLFYFLKNIKKEYGFEYIENDVGIPQEDVGEMSRLLANFYLHEFDEKFSKKLSNIFSNGQEYKYIRYADDLWIVFNDSESVSFLVSQAAAQCLADLGLHLNESKTRIFNNTQFKEYWEFANWDILDSTKENQNELLNFLKMIFPDDIKSKDTRWFSIFSYGLKCLNSFCKDNVSIEDADQEWLTQAILKSPKLFGRNSNPVVSLLSKFAIKDNNVRDIILEYLNRDNSVYPVVHYCLWYSLYNVNNAGIALTELETIYYQPSDEQGLWWYRRCIFLDFLIKFGDYHSNTKCFEKFESHVKNIHQNLNELERRYTLRLFISLPDMRGQRIIEQCFSEYHDTEFRNYIQSTHQDNNYNW